MLHTMNPPLEYAFTERQNPRLPAFLKGTGLAVWGAATLFAAWFIFQDAAKDTIIQTISHAMENGDIYTLSNNLDWIALQNGLKQDLRDRATHNASLPQDPEKLDQLVNFYVQPGNIPELMNYYRLKAKHIPASNFIRAAYASGLAEITIEIAPPPQFNQPWMNQLEPARAVFRPSLIGWKMKTLHIPDYMIPTRIPSSQS